MISRHHAVSRLISMRAADAGIGVPIFKVSDRAIIVHDLSGSGNFSGHPHIPGMLQYRVL